MPTPSPSKHVPAYGPRLVSLPAGYVNESTSCKKLKKPNMKQKIFNLSLLSLIITLLCLTSCHTNETDIEWKPEDGYISNEGSAIKVAEIVWLNVYGQEINDEKPYIAKLKDGKIWIVEGTFNGRKYAKGGVAYIEIQKSDGKILKVMHGK
jgi:hypothetical protein